MLNLRPFLAAAAVVVAVLSPGCRLFVDGVACDPDDQATCPEGTTCNPQGICVAGDDPVPPGNGPVCGDAIVNGEEACDFAAPAGAGACNFDCTEAVCGDGKRSADEDCDDDNTTDGDGCSAVCAIEGGATPVFCGDGIVNNGEACDFAVTGGPACNADCTSPRCGDRVVNGSEECDGGVRCRASTATTGACTVIRCGDGIVDTGEACDSSTGCHADCTIQACGDGFLDPGEQCDDNDVDAGDGCAADCRLEAFALCGNAVVDPGEECDVAGVAPCNPGCTTPFCGDGIVSNGEQCDSGVSCRATCTLARCGDSIVDPGEDCDSADRSTCNIDCTEASCGDGFLAPGEECDGAPGCRTTGEGACTFIRCGDGVVDPGEFCDSDLACTAQCTINPCKADGDGCFPQRSFLPTLDNGAAGDVEVADFDGDGDLDLVTVQQNTDGLMLFRGNGVGGFAVAEFFAGQTDTIISAVADFDSDGRPDVLGFGDNQFVIFFNTGAGFAAPTTAIPAGDDPRDADVGDIDGDGLLDVIIVSRNFNGIHTFKNPGNRQAFPATGTFLASNGPSGTTSGLARDFDNDGDIDVVVANDGFSGNPPFLGDGRLSMFENTGSALGVGVAASSTTSRAVGNLTAADLDSDGFLDVIAGGGGADLQVFYGRGNRTFDDAIFVTGVAGESSLARPAAVDADGDGIVDLVAASNETVSFMRGLGNRTFASPVTRFANGPINSVNTGDVDGDGFKDLLLSSAAARGVNVLGTRIVP